jgi:DNA uptake protein ComE-like DNA-binding protein
LDNLKKQHLFFVLMCVICSAAVSFLVCSLYFSAHITVNSPDTQTAIQTVNINEPPVIKININTATLNELKTLPGIGDATARKIVENRPYSDIWELMDIDGIGGEIMANIAEKIGV